MACNCRGHPPTETDAHRSSPPGSKCSHRRSPSIMRVVVTISLVCSSFHPGQSLRAVSPGLGLRLVNYSGSPCCFCSPSPCSLTSSAQEPELNSVTSCGSLSFSNIRTVGCPPLCAPSTPGPSASRLHDILGARRRAPYTTCFLRGGFSPDFDGSGGLGSFQDSLKRELSIGEQNENPIVRMSLGSGNAEHEGRDDRPTKNAADPPPTSQSEALENLERRSVSPGTKKIIQSASAPNLADGHLFPAVRTNGSARRNATKGYTSLVALKQAIDITAGWRSPDLSVQEAARRRAAGPKDWSTVSAEPRKTAAVPAKPLRPVERTDSTQATGGEVSEESSDDDSDVDSVLDVQRTLINIAIFLSTIAGWKGLWDIQDQYLTSYYSLGIGAALYFLRVKVDDILDTHDVHEEDWYELFEKLPELSLFSIESLSAYGRIYLSSGLVFVSSLFIWRGLWQALDDINVVGPICIALSAVSFIALSLTQLSLERKRLRNPDGPRSPSMYDEDELFTMGRPHFYPEEFQSSSEDSVNDSEQKDGDVVRAGSAEGKKRAVRSESAGGRKEGEGGVREEVQRALNAVDEDEEEAGRIRVFGGEGEEEGHGGAGAPASVAKAEEGRGRRVVD